MLVISTNIKNRRFSSSCRANCHNSMSYNHRFIQLYSLSKSARDRLQLFEAHNVFHCQLEESIIMFWKHDTRKQVVQNSLKNRIHFRTRLTILTEKTNSNASQEKKPNIASFISEYVSINVFVIYNI